MKDNLSRIALILAGMGLSASELKSLLSDLRSVPINDLVHQVSVLVEASTSWRHDQPASDRLQEVHGRQQRDASVGERVERLLKDEAKLSTAVCFDVMSKMLVESGALRVDEIPPLSKKALRVWVDRVLEKVPAKELLRLATIARNQYVHSPQADWSIGRRPE